MDWKDIAGKISNVAPLLGGLLGGPVGGAAGTAVKMLASGLGLSEQEATPEKINKLLGDTGAVGVIEKLENANQVELRKLLLESERLNLADKSDARAREVAVTQITGKRDYNMYILAWSVVLGFFVLCGLLMKYPLPEGQNQVVFMLFGAIATGFGTVLQYFFGSSKSSVDKTNLLTKESK